MSDQWDKFNELGEVLPYSWYSARLLYPYDPAPRDAMRPTRQLKLASSVAAHVVGTSVAEDTSGEHHGGVGG